MWRYEQRKPPTQATLHEGHLEAFLAKREMQVHFGLSETSRPTKDCGRVGCTQFLGCDEVGQCHPCAWQAIAPSGAWHELRSVWPHCAIDRATFHHRSVASRQPLTLAAERWRQVRRARTQSFALDATSVSEYPCEEASLASKCAATSRRLAARNSMAQVG